MGQPEESVVEHYQKTYELTYALWQQRNRTFLLLLGVISIATLLTFDVPQTQPLLVDVVAKFAGVTDNSRLAELRRGFPFGLLQSILLVVVFYLMLNLYHRAVYVLRNYRYLSRLESEIRVHLKLPDDSVAFTRESTFYWGERSIASGAVKWVYIAILGVMLAAFLGGRVWEDVRIENTGLVLADLAIAIPTMLFFLAYARSCVSLDTANVIVGEEEQDATPRVPTKPQQPRGSARG